MKKIFSITFKVTALVLIVTSTFLALVAQYGNNHWDPIEAIQQLKENHRRDDAIDLVAFLKENRICTEGQLKGIEEELSYGFLEKAKAMIWDGAIKGQVNDTHSGIGAMAADFCIFGDLRDITIQTWNTFFDKENFDGVIATLAGAGIAFSTTPMFDGLYAMSKNIAKYVARVPDYINTGMLKTFLAGRASTEQTSAIYNLLKKTNGPFPAQHPA